MNHYLEYFNQEKERVQQISERPNGVPALLEARTRLLKLVASLKENKVEPNLTIEEDLFFGLEDAAIFSDLVTEPDQLFEDAKVIILDDIDFVIQYLCKKTIQT